MNIDGGCHCGFIRYEAEIDPETVSICHCTDCQQLTGSAFRLTATAKPDHFRLRAGEPKLYTKTAESGRKSLQFFCPECGSPLYRTGSTEDDKDIGIRLGTIRQRALLAPKEQIWVGSALPFMHDLFDLPSHEKN